MPKQLRQSLYLLLAKKKKRAVGLHGLKLTDDCIAKLEKKLQGAKQRKRTKTTAHQETQRIMEGHLNVAMEQACFVQQTAIAEVILAAHPLSKEPALGRLVISFLCSIEIKALRSTCRAMTCFVHVHCEELRSLECYILGEAWMDGRNGGKGTNWSLKHMNNCCRMKEGESVLTEGLTL